MNKVPPTEEHEEDPNYEEIQLDFCLACGSKVHEKENENTQRLSKNLSVIFLMRNLLQVPERQVEGNFREYGNPENWIRLCDQCIELTRKAEDLYCKIVKIEKELRNVRKLIVNKIRSDAEDDSDIDMITTGENRERKEIWRKTRAFVTNCKIFLK